METDAPAAASKRPRPILLIMLGVVAAAFLLMQLGGSPDPSSSPSNSPRAPQRSSAEDAAKVDPSQLDVHLEALAGDRPEMGESERNPFRFRPPAPPPSPSPPPGSFKPPPVQPEVPSGPPP